MTTQTAAILLAAAIAFLIPLAGYALHLHLEAKRQMMLARESRAKEQQQARDKIMENLLLLVRAIEDRQVNLTEGCLRVRVFLDLLDEGKHVHHEAWAVIDQVHQKARQFATHAEREALPEAEREKQDQQRRALEEQFEAPVHQAAIALREFCEQQGYRMTSPLFVNAAGGK
jgi:quinol monooxygenase YgiN